MTDEAVTLIRESLCREEPVFDLDPMVAIRGGRARQRARRVATVLCLSAALGFTIVVGSGDAHAATPESQRTIVGGAP